MNNKRTVPFRLLAMIPGSLLIFFSCALTSDDRDYRAEMRDFVIDISAWAKTREPGFLIIPQNGQELFTFEGEPEGTLAESYIAAIDGTGREDLYYGWNEDGEATPAEETQWLEEFLDLAEENGVEALVIDYVADGAFTDSTDEAKADDAISKASARGYISFPAPSRELEVIPAYPNPLTGESTEDITGLAEAANFLYLINPETYASKDEFLAALEATEHDIVLIDAYWNGTEEYTSEQISGLKTKATDGSRLVIAYMSIGEAEDYRSYWDSTWNVNPPSWLAKENPDWPGNYKVRYWDEEWRAIIFGSDESILGYIVDAGFDGVYLDIIDAFEYFE